MPPALISLKPNGRTRKIHDCPVCHQVFDRASKVETHMGRENHFPPNDADDDDEIEELNLDDFKAALAKNEAETEIDELASTEAGGSERGSAVTESQQQGQPQAVRKQSLVASLLPHAIQYRQGKQERQQFSLPKTSTTTTVVFSSDKQHRGGLPLPSTYPEPANTSIGPSVTHQQGQQTVGIGNSGWPRQEEQGFVVATAVQPCITSKSIKLSNVAPKPIKKLATVLKKQSNIDLSRAMERTIEKPKAFLNGTHSTFSTSISDKSLQQLGVPTDTRSDQRFFCGQGNAAVPHPVVQTTFATAARSTSPVAMPAIGKVDQSVEASNDRNPSIEVDPAFFQWSNPALGGSKPSGPVNPLAGFNAHRSTDLLAVLAHQAREHQRLAEEDRRLKRKASELEQQDAEKEKYVNELKQRIAQLEGQKKMETHKPNGLGASKTSQDGQKDCAHSEAHRHDVPLSKGARKKMRKRAKAQREAIADPGAR